MRPQYDCSQRYCGLEGNDPVKSGNWEISTLNIGTEFFSRNISTPSTTLIISQPLVGHNKNCKLLD